MAILLVVENVVNNDRRVCVWGVAIRTLDCAVDGNNEELQRRLEGKSCEA